MHGNVGNLNLVWRVSGIEKEDFTSSLPVVEEVKRRYHLSHTCNAEGFVYDVWTYFIKC